MPKLPTPWDMEIKDMLDRQARHVLGAFEARALVMGEARQAAYRRGWAACVKALKETGVERSQFDSVAFGECVVCGDLVTDGHSASCELAAILNSVEVNDA